MVFLSKNGKIIIFLHDFFSPIKVNTLCFAQTFFLSMHGHCLSLFLWASRNGLFLFWTITNALSRFAFIIGQKGEDTQAKNKQLSMKSVIKARLKKKCQTHSLATFAPFWIYTATSKMATIFIFSATLTYHLANFSKQDSNSFPYWLALPVADLDDAHYRGKMVKIKCLFREKSKVENSLTFSILRRAQWCHFVTSTPRTPCYTSALS